MAGDDALPGAAPHSSSSRARGRVMALDFGKARTGVAVSDVNGEIARPLAAVARANTSDGLATIADAVASQGVERVVVGLPVSLGGGEGPQAARVRSFVDRLRKVLEVPVELHDERFTTRLADRVAAESGTSTSRDSLAACHILESYLEAQQ